MISWVSVLMSPIIANTRDDALLILSPASRAGNQFLPDSGGGALRDYAGYFLSRLRREEQLHYPRVARDLSMAYAGCISLTWATSCRLTGRTCPASSEVTAIV